MKNKIGSLGKKLGFKLIVLSIVLLFVGSSFVSSLSHTVDYSNASYFTDDSDTRIRNSNGNYWAATGANIQSAIDDLTDGGTVYLPADTISLTTPVIMKDNIHLKGVGNATILTQANSQNITLIENADPVNGNPGVKTSNFCLQGNGLNQAEYDGANIYDYKYGMELARCDGLIVENVWINNTHSGGIFVTESDWVTIKGCTFTNLGKLYKDSGNDLNNWYCQAVYFYNESNNNRISDCNVNNTYSTGFVVEGESKAVFDAWCYNTIIENCIVSDTEYGYYFEDARNVIVDNCIAIDCTDGPLYGSSGGVYYDVDTKYISVSDFIAYNCTTAVRYSGWYNSLNNVQSYNSIGDSFAITSGSNNCELIGCIAYDSGDDSFASEVGTTNISYIGCSSYNSTTIGIYDRSTNSKIQGCTIVNSGSTGIYVTEHNISIHDNDILSSGYRGIELNSADNCSVLDNTIKNTGNAGMYIFDSFSGDISHNYISECTQWGAGIQLDNSYQFNLIGNNIWGTGSAYPYYGIFGNNDADDHLVSLNRISKVHSGHEIFTVGDNSIVNDNFGYDNSTYSYIPCGDCATLYPNPYDGADCFQTTNQTRATYWNGQWWYYNHLG